MTCLSRPIRLEGRPVPVNSKRQDSQSGVSNRDWLCFITSERSSSLPVLRWISLSSINQLLKRPSPATPDINDGTCPADVSGVHSRAVRKRTAYRTAAAEPPVFAIQQSTAVVRDAGLDFRATCPREGSRSYQTSVKAPDARTSRELEEKRLKRRIGIQLGQFLECPDIDRIPQKSENQLKQKFFRFVLFPPLEKPAYLNLHPLFRGMAKHFLENLRVLFFNLDSAVPGKPVDSSEPFFTPFPGFGFQCFQPRSQFEFRHLRRRFSAH